MTDLTPWVQQFKSINDSDLRVGLKSLNLEIEDGKFTQGFSAYALSEAIARLDRSMIRNILGTPIDKVPDEAFDGNCWRAAFIFKSYTTFVYMRSEVLERGLDSVQSSSPIRPFRDFFRAGDGRNHEDTVAQHIRNSICHGTFTISQDFKTVLFTDRSWKASIEASQIYDHLCEQVKRFFMIAYEVSAKTESI